MKRLYLTVMMILMASTLCDAKVIAVNVQGEVQVIHSGKPQPLKEETILEERDVIRTAGKGSVDIVKSDFWACRLLGDTEASISSENDFKTILSVERGNALFSVNPDAKSSFEVSTPVMVAAVRGTKFWGRVTPRNKLSAGVFAVREGVVEIYLKALDVKMTLNESQAIDIPPGFEIPAVRQASSQELDAMKAIDALPTFLFKENLTKEISVLSQLGDAADKKNAEKSVPALKRSDTSK